MSSPPEDQAHILNMLLGTLPEPDDGFTGAQKLALGLMPVDTLGLRIVQSPRVDPETTQIVWEMSIERDKTVAGFLPALAPKTTDFSYQVRYSPTLDAEDSEWVTVATGNFVLDEGVEAKTDVVSMLSPEINPERGFFKVKILKK